MTTLHFVVPDGIDDPDRPSGGNAYDRQLSRGLTAMGWAVHEHPIPGPWPARDHTALAGLDGVLDQIPSGAVVLLDGLIASAAPEVLVPQAARLQLVVLVHMPLGHRAPNGVAADPRSRERAALSAATAVLTTSAWSRRRLVELYELDPARLHVAEPGAEAAEVATGTPTGGELLCVAAVTFDKGLDVLLDALATVTDLPWHCICVGSLDRDPVFADVVRRRAIDGGLDDRVCFAGPRAGADLDRSYATADLLVLPSRSETYGMVLTEALARGLPVIAADVGGVAEALGHGADGIQPGLLVPPDDSVALGAALRGWLGNGELRARLRRAARERRDSLPRWSTTTSVVADVLATVQ